MKIHYISFLVFLATLEAAIPTKEEKIQALEKQKKVHERNIKRHLNLAQRWQFDKDFFLEAQREYLLVEEQKALLQSVEKKLKILKEDSGLEAR
jgi:hypothetical protein